MTREERKTQALAYLKELNMYSPYINGFMKQDKVCYFERFGGYWVDQQPEVYAKMKDLEARFNATVYAITHEYTEFGECYSFLMVTNYPEEWDDLLFKEDGTFYVFAYVWNKDVEYFSEFGTIGVKSLGGGITRVA